MTAALRTLEQQLRQIDPPLTEEEITGQVEQLRSVYAETVESQVAILRDQWKLDHPLESPTYQQSLEIQQRATMIAADLVAALVNEPESPEPPEPLTPANAVIEQGGAVRRWTRDPVITSTPETEQLAEELWPTREPRFQVWAADLLQARLLDSLPLPSLQDTELLADLEKVVDAHLLTIS